MERRRHRSGGPRPDITAEPLDLSGLGRSRATRAVRFIEGLHVPRGRAPGAGSGPLADFAAAQGIAPPAPPADPRLDVPWVNPPLTSGFTVTRRATVTPRWHGYSHLSGVKLGLRSPPGRQ